MRLTIIPSDNAVYKDGLMFDKLDMSYVPPTVHALQWDGVRGWVEFCVGADLCKPDNEQITVLPKWAAQAVNAWDAAHQKMLNQQAAISSSVSEGLQSL